MCGEAHGGERPLRWGEAGRRGGAGIHGVNAEISDPGRDERRGGGPEMRGSRGYMSGVRENGRRGRRDASIAMKHLNLWGVFEKARGVYPAWCTSTVAAVVRRPECLE